MKKWLWIPAILLAFCCGCGTVEPSAQQKEFLLKLIEQLKEQDRISETNAKDLEKILKKEEDTKE